MASPDELAALFASAWSAGGGARPSAEHAAQLARLWREAAAAQPSLGAREFAVALAGLAPGPDGLASFLGRARAPEIALAATAASTPPHRDSPMPKGSQVEALAATTASGGPVAKGSVVSGLDATAASAQPVPPSRDAAPRNVPTRYRLIKKLGAGAMGVVWEAEDTQLHRSVALKWVTPSAAGDSGYRTRLFREARALAQLHHPNVVAVHDVGEVGDEVYIALELIRGTTARGWLDTQPRTPAEGLAVWRQAAIGLAAVHRAGIVHRDIKPDNVFVAEDGRVVVGDFGLATGDLGEGTMNLTATGAVIGTPLYMAPEQLHGEAATQAGDQFSLCVCLWEAMAGKRPFDATTLAGLAVAMLKVPAIPVGADRRLFGVLQRGLATEPKERWDGIAQLMQALDAPPAKKRAGVIAIAAAIVVGVGGVAAWKLTRPAETDTASVSASAGAAGSAAGSAAATPPTSDLPGIQRPAPSGSNATAPITGAAQKTSQLPAKAVAALAPRTAGSATPPSPPPRPTPPVPPPTVSSTASDALDAPPESAWPKRAAKRLREVAYAHQSCQEVLDFIAAKHLTLPRDVMDPGQKNERVFCFYTAGKCAEAHALFLEMRLVPNATPDQREMLEAAWDQSFPRCART